MGGKWTLERRLFVSVGMMTGFLFALFLTAWWTIKHDKEETAVATRRMQLASEIQHLNMEVFGIERAVVVAFLADDTETVEKWHAKALAQLEQALVRCHELRDLVVTDADRASVDRMSAGFDRWKTGCAACHDDAAAVGDVAVMQRLSAKTAALMEGNSALAGGIVAEQTRRFDEVRQQASGAVVKALGLMMAVLALSMACAFVVFRTVRAATAALAGISSGLNDSAAQMAAASSQVSASAQSLAGGVSEQAASLEETSASMEEMASMARQNSADAEEASKLFAGADLLSARATTALEDMRESMRGITESGREVSKIIKVVDEIAFQTNILALNAAVEAARAGEAGMGFAVVADEVRRLAQRSANAAHDTSALIEKALAASGHGDTRVTQLGETIHQMTNTVAQVKQIVDAVSGASRQQQTGFGQVSQAVTQMEQVTQRTAATAEENAAASEELSAQTETTLDIVRQLESLVGVRPAERRLLATAASSNGKAQRSLVVVPGAGRRPERGSRVEG